MLKRVPLAIGVIFTLTAFILTIVATAGSNSNHKPINNVYLGEADISRINVTKVIPETGPVLGVLAGLMNGATSSSGSGNASSSAQEAQIEAAANKVLEALKRVAQSPAALQPLMTLLGDSSNVSQTVGALAQVAKSNVSLASSSGSSQQLALVSQLLQTSSNASETLQGLVGMLQTANATSAAQQRAVLGVLGDSSNATASVDALVQLDNQTAASRAQLAPVLAIFQYSSNTSATLSALGSIMSANLSSSTAEALLSTLRDSDSSMQQTLSQLASAASDASERASILALGLLFNSSSDSQQTLSTLTSLIQSNVTTSPSARNSFVALSSLFSHSSNKTLVLSSVSLLANSSSAASSAQLTALQELLESSTNTNTTLSVLQQVAASSNSSSAAAAAAASAQTLTPIASLLAGAKNSTLTMQSALQLTQAMAANSTLFQPLLSILSTATMGSTAITRDTLDTMMPIIMDNLNVNSHYRLAIFTLCRGFSDGKMRKCNSPHAVQNFVLRDILYDELENSDFKPYMQALNVQKSDMYLEGSLQKKQDSYVPAVRAVLAFNLLAIILSFFLMLAILAIFFMKSGAGKRERLTLLISKVLAFFVTLFTLLSGAITAAFVGIIKRDTKKDDYNVFFATGSAFQGLIWTAFVLALITFVLLFFVRPKAEQNNLDLGEFQPAVPTSSSDDPEPITEKPASKDAPEQHVV
ncbi:LAQU0S01e01838g1_1 [Lachancea quebecensis]|uniref:LAQU0S01e01838g1_1 n=1 Tax=Lachancea quebecensis TaxID=1654605 RepID=A0A0P1KKT8_9SACH|nr:LAQU0S01e01838g1_1 [Lachancea quebecensis]